MGKKRADKELQTEQDLTEATIVQEGLGKEFGIKQGRSQYKTKPTFNLSLNAEQKKVKASLLPETITVLTGKAGSGKTLLATQVALEYLHYKEVSQIIITRPTVSDEEIGFLPGDMKEKMDPWLSPIYSNMYALKKKADIIKYVSDGVIEIVPLAFMRGRTFANAFVIIDEAQNVSKTQMKMILTRLGVHSKMIICGDASQTDLKKKTDSGLNALIELAGKIDGFGHYMLETNNRHAIVEEILKHIDD